jgi:hypothetical protein
VASPAGAGRACSLLATLPLEGGSHAFCCCHCQHDLVAPAAGCRPVKQATQACVCCLSRGSGQQPAGQTSSTTIVPCSTFLMPKETLSNDQHAASLRMSDRPPAFRCCCSMMSRAGSTPTRVGRLRSSSTVSWGPASSTARLVGRLPTRSRCLTVSRLVGSCLCFLAAQVWQPRLLPDIVGMSAP